MKLGLADGAGVTGAIVAALCCAGNALIVAGLAGVGLGFLRKDAILWPIMIASLGVAVWGFWKSRTVHRNSAPLVLGFVSAVSLAAGVIFVHGPPAMTMIYAGASGLVLSALLNVRMRWTCATAPTTPPS